MRTSPLPALGLVLCFACAPSVSSDPKLEALLEARGFDPARVSVAGRKVKLDGVPVLGLEAKRVDGEPVMPMLRWDAPEPKAKPRLTPADAIAKVDRQVLQTELALQPSEELRQRPGTSGDDAEDWDRVITSTRLVYRLVSERGGAHFITLIDAETGEQLSEQPLRLENTTLALVTGHGYYNGDQQLAVQYTDDGDSTPYYELQDTFGNEVFASEYSVVNGQLQRTLQFFRSATPSFGNGSQYFNVNDDPWGVTGATAGADAMYGVKTTWDMFYAVMRQPGSDGNGTPLDVAVHSFMANSGYDPVSRLVDIGWTSLNPDANGNRVPRSCLDIVAHEIGHDFHHTLVYGDPNLIDPPGTEALGLHEGTGDIVAFLTELYRDAVAAGQTSLDAQPLASHNLTLGEQVTPGGDRKLLTPTEPYWRPGLTGLDAHVIAGPIDRWFLLLSYGCQPITTSPTRWPTQPPPRPGPWQCDTVPQGFAGIGPMTAAAIWKCTLNALPPGSRYVDARAAALGCAAQLDARVPVPFPHGTTSTAFRYTVGAAFTAIHVGPLPDSNPPTASFSCVQAAGYVDCSGLIQDEERWSPLLRQPTLSLDGDLETHTLSSWSFSDRFATTGLTDGLHTVTLEAWDVWQNKLTQTVNVTLDMTPPTGTVTVSGTPRMPLYTVNASDPSGISRVEFTDSHSPSITTSDAIPPYEYQLDTTGWADGVYTETIRVYDSFDNVLTFAKLVVADATPPLVSMSVTGTESPFTVNASAVDANPLAQAELLFDGTVIAVDTTQPFTFSFAPQTGGSHTLAVRITDVYGNAGLTSQPSPLDAVAPVVTFAASQAGDIVSIAVNVADPCGLTTPYGFYVDGVLIASLTTGSNTVALNPMLALGAHLATVVVSDGCGNTASPSYPFEKVLHTKPVITSITRDDTNKKKPRFTIACNAFGAYTVDHIEAVKNGSVIASDAIAPYEIVIDSTTWPDGDQVISFFCVDSGMLPSDAEVRTVTADNTGPSFSISVYGGGFQYWITAEQLGDVHGIASVKFQAGLVLGFTTTITSSPWSVVYNVPVNTSGAHPFAITATDTWGNLRSKMWWCQIDTNNTTQRFLLCEEDTSAQQQTPQSVSLMKRWSLFSDGLPPHHAP